MINYILDILLFISTVVFFALWMSEIDERKYFEVLYGSYKDMIEKYQDEYMPRVRKERDDLSKKLIELRKWYHKGKDFM